LLLFKYNICLKAPEDTGQCFSYDNTDKHMCLEEKSMFDSERSLCKWVGLLEEQDDPVALQEGGVWHSCVYLEPIMSWKVCALFTRKLVVDVANVSPGRGIYMHCDLHDV
jgi:hypothetical protein